MHSFSAALVRSAWVGVQETVRVEGMYLHMRCACLVGMCGGVWVG